MGQNIELSNDDPFVASRGRLSPWSTKVLENVTYNCAAPHVRHFFPLNIISQGHNAHIMCGISSKSERKSQEATQECGSVTKNVSERILGPVLSQWDGDNWHCNSADFQVLPLLLIGFATYQLDRTNLSSALTGGLADDLSINQNTINLGNQFMFLGVITLEIPSNVILYKVGYSLSHQKRFTNNRRSDLVGG